MKVSDLQAALTAYDRDTEIVLLAPHCCGDGDDFEPLSGDAMGLIPVTGKRRRNLSPLSVAYSMTMPAY